MKPTGPAPAHESGYDLIQRLSTCDRRLATRTDSKRRAAKDAPTVDAFIAAMLAANAR